jgi:hypothetical protein
MMFDKKKVATIVVSKMKPSKAEMLEDAPSNEMGDVKDDDIAKQSAAEELLKAIESKDAKAVAAAFSSMMELCNSEEPEEEYSEQKESEE